MCIDKPYHRIFRPIKNQIMLGNDAPYMRNPYYAKKGEQYIQAYNIIQKDLLEIFEYIEPCDNNLRTYSFRIQELFIRTCIEIENNFKAIFSENKFSKTNTNIHDYYLIDKTHHLSEYEIKLPIWDGKHNLCSPFEIWKTANISPTWYKAYNECKHNRQEKFYQANFENLIDAVTALLILLSSQFYIGEFLINSNTPIGRNNFLINEKFGIGNYFYICFPTNWSDDEKYIDKNLDDMSENAFDKFDYDSLKGD